MSVKAPNAYVEIVDSSGNQVDSTHPIYTSPATGSEVNVSDRAARDLGKVDIAAFDSALPSGTNLMGKVGIDQTTPGTTNGVVVTSITAGDTNIGNVDASIADGADVTLGAKADAVSTDPTATVSLIALTKGIIKQLQGTGTGNAPIRFVPRATQISTDATSTWAASSVINTQKNVDFALPASPCNIYQVICLNPSRVSDIAVDVKVVEPTFNSETRRIKLTSFNVSKATALQLFNDESAPFVTAQGANVVCSTDAVTYKVSTHSAKLAIGAGATTGLLASVATTGTYNLSIYSHLWFWIYSSIALDAGDLTMSVDDTAACASPIETISIPAIAATTWTKLYIPMVDPTLCTAIVSMGINMAVDKGAFDLYLDDVSAFKPGSEAPLIEGLHNGVGSRFSVYNTTALGANDAFSFYLRLKEYR